MLTRSFEGIINGLISVMRYFILLLIIVVSASAITTLATSFCKQLHAFWVLTEIDSFQEFKWFPYQILLLKTNKIAVSYFWFKCFVILNYILFLILIFLAPARSSSGSDTYYISEPIKVASNPTVGTDTDDLLRFVEKNWVSANWVEPRL